MKRSLLLRPFTAILLMAFVGLFTAGWDAQSRENLPQVLIIGDSISLGYTPYVAQILKAEATVKHSEGNAQDTKTGLKNLDAWIGTTRWDVIYFNWGLWDLCYRHPDAKNEGHRDKVRGTITTGLKQYERNLDQLVRRLKKTNAVLIWANTTIVPEGEAGRFAGDDKKYNEAAARVMRKHGIRVDDLHALTERFTSEVFIGPENVHYKEDGYRKLANQVAGKIRTALKDGSNRP